MLGAVPMPEANISSQSVQAVALRASITCFRLLVPPPLLPPLTTLQNYKEFPRAFPEPSSSSSQVAITTEEIGTGEPFCSFMVWSIFCSTH